MQSQYSNKNATYYGNARHDISPLLPENYKRVLEVGCGDGATLKWLKAMNSSTETIGIEKFPEAAKKAKENCDELLEGGVEEHILGLSNDSFDVVLCLDVLEHLEDPWLVLKDIHRVLKLGGSLICSLPNVRHKSVILPLIFKNEWKYEKSGIMDSTHLRFFTPKTAIRSLTNESFIVEKVIRKMPKKTSKSGLLNMLLLGALTDFITPQFMIAAKKHY